MSRHRHDVVLRLRKLAEDEAKIDLARALGALDRAVAGRRACVANLTAEREHGSRLGGGSPARAWEFVDADSAIEAAERSLEAAETVVRAEAARVEAARAVMVTATQRREAVERLRDRIRAAELLAAARREERELNEISQSRHARMVIEGVR